VTEDLEKAYSKAKSRYHNAQRHLASMETKFRQQASKVESLRKQLDHEESILKRSTEKYETAKEMLHENRQVYRDLKHEWKSGSA
jgi:peptidoglycan hydrolase CwlO-like protein